MPARTALEVAKARPGAAVTLNLLQVKRFGTNAKEPGPHWQKLLYTAIEVQHRAALVVRVSVFRVEAGAEIPGSVQTNFVFVVGDANRRLRSPVIEAGIGETAGFVIACRRVDRQHGIELPEVGFPGHHDGNQRHVADTRGDVFTAH